MTTHKSSRISSLFLLVALVLGTIPGTVRSTSAAAQSAPQQPPQRDGQHDFDFNQGTWRTHIKYLYYPTSGSPRWSEMNGTVTVRNIWEGRGWLEEIKTDGENGKFEGMTLFLYNPQTHQWSQTFANSSNGTLVTPLIGSFQNGRGELVAQQPYHGRTVLMRAVWSDIKPNSHHFEEDFSDDAGATWNPAFIADLTREKQ
jgi:hypothetical protein